MMSSKLLRIQQRYYYLMYLAWLILIIICRSLPSHAWMTTTLITAMGCRHNKIPAVSSSRQYISIQDSLLKTPYCIRTTASLYAFSSDDDSMFSSQYYNEDDDEEFDDDDDRLSDEELEATMGEWDERIAQFNLIPLSGRIGNDPEPRYFDDGKVVVNLILASKRKIHNVERKLHNVKYGEEETDWYGLEIWGQTAEFVSKYVKKGARVGVSGQLQLDTWIDKDSGEPRNRVKIIVREFDLLETKAEAELRRSNNSSSGQQQQQQQQRRSFFTNDDDDDDDDYNSPPSRAGSGGFFDM